MGLNIKNQTVEDLATQVAAATGETKTEAIRVALTERRDRLGLKSVEQRIADLGARLEAIHAGRHFEPVTKAEWDSLNDD